MSEPVVLCGQKDSSVCAADDASAAYQRLAATIVDGVGGELALALTDDGAHLLAHAIGMLTSGQLAHGSVVKVTTRDRVYALSRAANAAGDPIIRVSDIYNPQASVDLSLDLAGLVAALLASSERLSAQVATE